MKAFKLWHFDWLYYLRLLGECRSFLSEPSGKRRQSPTTTGGEQFEEDHHPESIKVLPMAFNHSSEKLKTVFNELNEHRHRNTFAKCSPSKQQNAATGPDSNCSNNIHKTLPMDTQEFRRRGKEMVDYIADYMETIHSRRVTPNVEPGYLKNFLPKSAPLKSESWDSIMEDFEKFIMPGVTHWQHPRFHAYFPAGNSYPSILADMISDGIGCVGFSWVSHVFLLSFRSCDCFPPTGR